MFVRRLSHVTRMAWNRPGRAAQPMVGGVKFFSDKVDKTNGNIPLEFYHEETENDRQLLEVISALKENKDFRSLPSVKKILTWKDIQAAKENAEEGELPNDNSTMPFESVFDKHSQMEAFSSMLAEENEMETYLDEDSVIIEHDNRQRRFFERAGLAEGDGQNLKDYQSALEKHSSRFDDVETRPIDNMLNFTSTSLTDAEDNTVKNKSVLPSFEMDRGAPCPGKKQRSSIKGVLRCTKIDLDTIHHLDVMALRTYVNDDAEIKKRSGTGLCAKCQRHVARTIKRARHMGLMPHIGNFDIYEYHVDDPSRHETHTSIRDDEAYFESGVHK